MVNVITTNFIHWKSGHILHYMLNTNQSRWYSRRSRTRDTFYQSSHWWSPRTIFETTPIPANIVYQLIMCTLLSTSICRTVQPTNITT